MMPVTVDQPPAIVQQVCFPVLRKIVCQGRTWTVYVRCGIVVGGQPK